MGGMPSGLVEDNNSMGAVGDLRADFRKMAGSWLGCWRGAEPRPPIC